MHDSYLYGFDQCPKFAENTQTKDALETDRDDHDAVKVIIYDLLSIILKVEGVVMNLWFLVYHQQITYDDRQSHQCPLSFILVHNPKINI